MEGANQMVLTSVGLGIAFLLYEYGSKVLKDSQRVIDGGDPDTWGSDPVIKDRKLRAQLDNQQFPACQVWDDTFQVFIDTGDKNADGNPNVCYSSYGLSTPGGKLSNARYVTEANGVESITYAREDPLDDDPAQHGTCWFLIDGQWTTFPDAVSVHTAPNRSSRLCFGAGETAESQGRFFQRDRDNAVIMAPTVLPGPFPRCETQLSVPPSSSQLPSHLPPFAVDVANILAWAPDGGNSDLTTCLAAAGESSGTHKRYVTNDYILFKNQLTGTIEQMPNVPF